jgi:hypothetical protein
VGFGPETVSHLWHGACIRNGMGVEATDRAGLTPNEVQVLSFLGMLAFLMAAVDAICRLFGWPLTTLSWSPLLFVVLGFVFVTLEAWVREISPPADFPADHGRS